MPDQIPFELICTTRTPSCLAQSCEGTSKYQFNARVDIQYCVYIVFLMWTIVVTHMAAKQIEKLPRQAAEKYKLWRRIVMQSGPRGLRDIKSFHDEKLQGQWAGHRSSRLTLQWRLIYRVESETVTTFIEEVNPHKY